MKKIIKIIMITVLLLVVFVPLMLYAYGLVLGYLISNSLF